MNNQVFKIRLDLLSSEDSHFVNNLFDKSIVIDNDKLTKLGNDSQVMNFCHDLTKVITQNIKSIVLKSGLPDVTYEFKDKCHLNMILFKEHLSDEEVSSLTSFLKILDKFISSLNNSIEDNDVSSIVIQSLIHNDLVQVILDKSEKGVNNRGTWFKEEWDYLYSLEPADSFNKIILFYYNK